MAIPKYFCTPEQYFHEIISFLQEYQYLYKHRNTDILVDNVLENIDVNIEDINDDFNLRNCNNEYIKKLIKKIDILKPDYNDFVEDKDIGDITVPALSEKKKHEIKYLAKEIKNVCEMADCDVVVDFGSGLGYLDQRLYDITNYKILGLECNENNYVAAKKRQNKYHLNSKDDVKFMKHRVTVNSSENYIQAYLEYKFRKSYFCIAGLHACADLTVDALNIFLKMDTVKCLVIMPCCYHKMEGVDGKCTNFPLSNAFKNIYDEFHAYEYLKVPFLRLSAQPPNWKDKMKDLVFNLLSRAVLEVYARKHDCKLKRNKRKAVKTNKLGNDFESYAKNTLSGFHLAKKQSDDECTKVEIDLEELISIWRQLPDSTFKRAGIYITLQNYMQRIIENLILYDRIIYLKENKIYRCEVKKIVDENISPRCLALIAYK